MFIYSLPIQHYITTINHYWPLDIRGDFLLKLFFRRNWRSVSGAGSRISGASFSPQALRCRWCGCGSTPGSILDQQNRYYRHLGPATHFLRISFASFCYWSGGRGHLQRRPSCLHHLKGVLHATRRAPQGPWDAMYNGGIGGSRFESMEERPYTSERPLRCAHGWIVHLQSHVHQIFYLFNYRPSVCTIQ